MIDWLTAKTLIVEITGLQRDALHIYFAIAIHLATVALTRLRLDQWRGLLPLLALELLNEALDLTLEIWPPGDRGDQWWFSGVDVINTMAVPALIVLVARRTRAPAAAVGEEPTPP